MLMLNPIPNGYMVLFYKGRQSAVVILFLMIDLKGWM